MHPAPCPLDTWGAIAARGLTNEGVANGLFEEIEEIEEALMERCLELLDQAETIRALTDYHWWPQVA